jgi:hypothetical protein
MGFNINMTTLSAKTMLLLLLHAKLQLAQHCAELVQQIVTHLLRVVLTKRTFDGTEIHCLISDAQTRRKVEQQHKDTVTIDAVLEEVLRLREERAFR